MAFSKWWLRYFNYGPIEWLWRSATLLKWQPMIKRREIPAPIPVLVTNEELIAPQLQTVKQS
jgi:hypothetical protein